MGELIEDIALKDRLFVFKDSEESGKLLSKILKEYKNDAIDSFIDL